MKYIAIINTDEPFTEHTIQFIKNTIFHGDERAPYVFEIEDIKYKAESEPRKAIWIERSDIPRGCGEYLCSNCMDEYGTDLLYTYCPNCGAYHGKNKETIKEKDFLEGNGYCYMFETQESEDK